MRDKRHTTLVSVSGCGSVVKFWTSDLVRIPGRGSKPADYMSLVQLGTLAHCLLLVRVNRGFFFYYLHYLQDNIACTHKIALHNTIIEIMSRDTLLHITVHICQVTLTLYYLRKGISYKHTIYGTS